MQLNLKFKKYLFLQNLFIWGISFHNLKYLDKPIKCLEMRAKIKSVRKIYKIFLCISLIFENWTFFTHTSMLTKNDFLVILKANYQNVQAKRILGT